MSVRLPGIVGFALISLACASQASADWCFGIFDSIARDTKRRQCWPEPFSAVDRAAARAPFATMVANGWRRQNMLGDLYFEPNSGQLTEAGRQKVRWILTVCPEQHRLIYVHTTDSKEETTARFTAIRQLAVQLTPNNLPPMLPTAIADDGWSAEEVQAIGREYLKSMPKPRLPDQNSGSTGGMSSSITGGGGGGGGGN